MWFMKDARREGLGKRGFGVGGVGWVGVAVGDCA
jgi:hypothetical protein